MGSGGAFANVGLRGRKDLGQGQEWCREQRCRPSGARLVRHDLAIRTCLSLSLNYQFQYSCDVTREDWATTKGSASVQLVERRIVLAFELPVNAGEYRSTARRNSGETNRGESGGNGGATGTIEAITGAAAGAARGAAARAAAETAAGMRAVAVARGSSPSNGKTQAATPAPATAMYHPRYHPCYHTRHSYPHAYYHAENCTSLFHIRTNVRDYNKAMNGIAYEYREDQGGWRDTIEFYVGRWVVRRRAWLRA